VLELLEACSSNTRKNKNARRKPDLCSNDRSTPARFVRGTPPFKKTAGSDFQLPNQTMATALMGMGTKAPTLRYPFKVAADAGSFVVDKVNKSVDSSMAFSKKSMEGIKKK
jgi:hypothetical protein